MKTFVTTRQFNQGAGNPLKAKRGKWHDDVYKADNVDILPAGHTVEVDEKDLTGDYQHLAPAEKARVQFTRHMISLGTLKEVAPVAAPEAPKV